MDMRTVDRRCVGPGTPGSLYIRWQCEEAFEKVDLWFYLSEKRWRACGECARRELLLYAAAAGYALKLAGISGRHESDSFLNERVSAITENIERYFWKFIKPWGSYWKQQCRIRCLLFIERPLDFSSGLMYNLLRKVIGHEFRLPSVKLFVERTSIFTLEVLTHDWVSVNQIMKKKSMSHYSFFFTLLLLVFGYLWYN